MSLIAAHVVRVKFMMCIKLFVYNCTFIAEFHPGVTIETSDWKTLIAHFKYRCCYVCQVTKNIKNTFSKLYYLPLQDCCINCLPLVIRRHTMIQKNSKMSP